jgi:hypothetical protein
MEIEESFVLSFFYAEYGDIISAYSWKIRRKNYDIRS